MYNNLQFDDLENTQIDWLNSYNKTYAPQDTILLGRSDNANIVTLTAVCGGTGNQYQWYKDDHIIESETQNTIIQLKNLSIPDGNTLY